MIRFKFNSLLLGACLLCMAACQADPDYDVSKLDSTVTIGKNITFPVGDIKEVKLGNLLFSGDVDPNEYLKIDDNGIYCLTFSAGGKSDVFSIAPEQMRIPGFFDSRYDWIPVNPDINVTAGSDVTFVEPLLYGPWPADKTYPVSVSLGWNFPRSIESIVSARVDANVKCSLYCEAQYSDAVAVTIEKGSQIVYPEWITIDGASAGNITLTVDGQARTITFPQDIAAQDNLLELDLHVASFDNLNLAQMRDEYGEMRLSGEFGLTGNMSMALKDGFVSGGRVTSDINIGDIYVDFSFNNESDIHISSADVIINEDIFISEYLEGNVIEQYWDLPDFLRNVDGGIVFDNLQMSLSFDNALPSGLSLDTEFYSDGYFSGDRWNPSFHFDIPQGKSTTVLTERELPGLNSVLSPLPSMIGLKLNGITLADTSEPITIEPGRNYGIGAEGKFEAPLSFTTALHNLALYSETKAVELSMTVVNTLPVSVELLPAAADFEGHAIQRVELSMTPSTIKAGAPGNPSKTPVVISMKSDDGLKFESLLLHVELGSDPSLSGTRIDPEQGIAFEDVKLHLPEGYVL